MQGVHGRRVMGGQAESTYTIDRHSGRPIIFCPNEPRALMYFKNFVRLSVTPALKIYYILMPDPGRVDQI